MVLGPSGSGKTVLLAELARDSARLRGAPTPTVFLRMRLPLSQAPLPEGVTNNSRTSLAAAHKLMDSVAAQVFRPIGFPPRRALVLSVPRALSWHLATILDIPVDFTSPSSHRLCDALRLLFDVLEQLCHERHAGGVPRDEAAPVLLLDGVQDLVTASFPCTAAAGGRAVFNTIAQLLAMYCVDRGVVRAAVAGCSASLSMEFDRTVASGSSWRYYDLRDPEEGAVLEALGARDYTTSEAAKLVALCGTRLRLLQPALEQGAELVSAHELAASLESIAVRHYRDLFHRQLHGDDKMVMSRLLDQAEAAELTKCEPPKRNDAGVSEELLAHASKVLYLRLDGSCVFQSALHRAAWQRVRTEF